MKVHARNRPSLSSAALSSSTDLSALASHKYPPYLFRRAILFLSVVFALSFTPANLALAHPMDLGVLKIESAPGNERIRIDIKIHRLAVDKNLLPGKDPTAEELFEATIGAHKPKLNGIDCDFLTPQMNREEVDFINLQSYLVCRGSRNFQLSWQLSFLSEMPAAFQLMIQSTWNGKTVVSTLNRDSTNLEIGDSSLTFFGFVKMGMAHIGVSASEWMTRDGHIKLAEGLDHIFFVLALVLAGRGLWALLKTVSGFTLGHSLTLALTMFQIIHIHSRWIEVGIAASIAFVAARAFLFKGGNAENWIVATLFGAIHGLGFSAALRDLELPTSQILPALVGFNFGVEIGQAILILLFLGILWLLRKHEAQARRYLGAALFMVGIYWTYSRIVG